MSKRLSFCLQAAKLHDIDSSALSDAIEQYVTAGMKTEEAEAAAIEDVLASIATDRQEITEAVAAQYPQVADQKEPSVIDKPASGQPASPKAKPKKAKAAPSPEELRARADLGNAMADLADLLGKGTRLNMMPEQEAKLMPVLARVFDAALRLGYIKFANAAQYVLEQIRTALGQEVADAITIDHLQGAYIAMAGKYREQGSETAKAVVAVESKQQIAEQADNEDDHVPSSSDSVERDSGKPAAGPVLGAAVPDGRDPDGERDARNDIAAGGQGSGRDSGAGVPDGGATAGGERGDQRVHPGGEPDGSKVGTAGGDFGERGSVAGIAGVPLDPIPASALSAAAHGNDAAAKLAAQRAGNQLAVKAADLENIRATLPALLEGQQEDVQKAETRWAKPDGYGMLLTNGTGTGKTFSGLGAIRRSVTAGRGDILIVVPDNKIAEDWQQAGKLLDLAITPLENTKTAGKGVVITSYANLGANDALASRDWHMVVTDEAHMLMQAAEGDATLYINALRAITHHPDGVGTRYAMLNRADLDELQAMTTQLQHAIEQVANQLTPAIEAAAYEKQTDALEPKIDALRKKLRIALDKVRDEVDAKQGAPRARLLALSATPFAYEKTIDWANGYLFDYKEGYPYTETSLGYNEPDPREHFFMQHLGYRKRFGKLTQPDAKVDSGLMQRQFNSYLKKQGALSGRVLDVPHDYDRRFVLVDSKIGNDIDAALDWIDARTYGADKVAGMGAVRDAVQDSFDYLSRRYLLEAIKAQEAVPIVKAHLALNRKVVVFHDYKKGGGFNPFDVHPKDAPGIGATDNDREQVVDFNTALNQFRAAHPELVAINFAAMRSPIETFSKAFPDVLLVNGDEKPRDLLRRYTKFQDDSSGPMVMLVQSDKNKGWSGHDTTGKNQRVLINLGQPTKPTLSIQQEGRIYRTGQGSDAIFRYLNTGTNWEKWAFAHTIAGRASAAENLGMGEQARALKDAYIAAFEESDAFPPGHEGEGTGGKARDKAANDALSEFDRAKAFYWATQKKTSKTKAQEGKDYFATPEPLGLKMVQWANIRGGEDALEPSAGHGAIARWFPELANRTAIEPSGTLRPRLALVFEGKIVASTFEDHNVVNKYDGIVMTSPFGVGGKTAIDHLAKAATHIREGGRIVALIPSGPMADKRLEAFLYNERPAKPLYTEPKLGKMYRGDTLVFSLYGTERRMVLGDVHTSGVPYAIAEGGDLSSAINLTVFALQQIIPGPRTENTNDLHLIADFKLPPVTFERAGTNVVAHVIVLQKGKDAPQQITRDLSNVEDINQFFDRIENIELKPRPEQAEPEAAPVKAAAQPKPGAVQLPPVAVGDLVEVTTKAGKVLRGVLRTDLTREQAKAIDPFTWIPKGHQGYFIREKYLQGGKVAKEERAVYKVNEPASNYDLDLFPTELEGQGAAQLPMEKKGRALKAVAPAAPSAAQANVLAVRQSTKLPGLYHVSSQLVQVGTKNLGVERVIDWDSAAEALGSLSRMAVEHFDMLITDKDGKVLAIVGSFKGALTQTSVYPGVLAMEALRIEGAAHAWGVHNHPSGQSVLSRADESLSLALGHLFHPSSIEYHGVAAVGAQADGTVKWNAVDQDEHAYRGQFTASAGRFPVPVVEREITALGTSETLTSPAVAKVVLARISQGRAGLLLVNSQNTVTAWLPGNPSKMARGTGKEYDELVNSLAEASAASVIVSNPDGQHTDSMPALKTRLALLDVRVLDAVNPVDNTSMAERGLLEPDDLLAGYDKQEALDKAKREEDARKEEEKAKNAKAPEKKVTADQVDLFNPQGGLFSRAYPTESANFKKWFAGSKVVDTKGKPLVVYHGTNSDIQAFKDSEVVAGFHFGSVQQADMRVAGVGKNILPLYLSIQNPGRSTDSGGKWVGKIKAAKRAGHDGIVYLNRYEGIPREAFERAIQEIAAKRGGNPDYVRLDSLSDSEFKKVIPEATESYIAFHPEQIKSAIGNSGAFDAKNPNISMRQGAEPTGGMSVADIKAALAEALTGLGSKATVFSTAADATRATGLHVPASAKGFYFKGKINLVAAGIANALEAEETLWHEVNHAGIDVLYPQGSVKYQNAMRGLAMQNANIREAAKTWLAAFGEADTADRVKAGMTQDIARARTKLQAVEEALSELAGRNAEIKGLAKFIAAVQELLRAIGLEKLANWLEGKTDAQALAMIFAAREAVTMVQPEGGGAANVNIETVSFSRAATLGTLTPEQEASLRHVGAMKVPQTLAERMAGWKANMGMRWTQGLFDQFAPLKALSQHAYMVARLSKGSDGTMEAALMYGKPFLRDGVPDVDMADGGFAKVLATLKGEHDRFLWWVAAQRAELLKAQGRENLFTDDDISNLRSLGDGDFADGSSRAPVYAAALQQLNAFNDSVLKVAEDSGLIDSEARELFQGQPYVPFYRVMDDEEFAGPRFSSGLVNQRAYKKLKGGTSQLNGDLLENMLLNWSHLYSAAARNRAAEESMSAAEHLAIAYQVPAHTKDSVRVMRGGVASHWMIEDPYLMEAVSAINYAPSPLMAPLAKAKKVLTWSVTTNPMFKVRNLLRDSVAAVAQADLSYNVAKNVAQGWKASSKHSQTYASMLASGGVMRFGSNEDASRVRSQIEKLGGRLADESGMKTLTRSMEELWEVYNDLGDRSENINRTALYEQLLAKGKTHAEASFMARDLMDFSMSGKWPVIRFLTQTVPFLNARLQGLYKLGRAAKEDPKRFATIAMAVSVASVGLMAAYSDDDDWKKREDWDRDGFWWFKIGEHAYRIPKPFEVGAIGTLSERTAELMFSKEMTNQRFADRLAFMVSQTFSLNPVPQAIAPLFDVYSNKDSFTKRAIESVGDLRLRPQDRYDERTSEVARFLGQLGLPEPSAFLKGEYTALSPKQLDFLLKGYFSWVGASVASVTDYAVRPMLDRGERPAMKLRGGFVEELPAGGSRYVTAFYEQAKDIEQAYASYRQALHDGDTGKAQSILAGGQVQNHVAVAHARNLLQQINTRAKQVEANKMMSGEAKRQQLDALDVQRNAIAQRYGAATGYGVAKNP